MNQTLKFDHTFLKKKRTCFFLILILKIYEKNFALKRCNKDKERVITEASQGVNIKLNPIRNGRRILTIA
jgi:hypothetical protein